MYDPNYAKVILLDLPCAVHGFVVSDGFDFYTIVSSWLFPGPTYFLAM